MDIMVYLFEWVVGLFKKAPKVDEVRSNESKRRIREIFNQCVPDGDQYKVVWASSSEARLDNYIVVRVHTSTITNYIVGYREDELTIVFIQVSPDLQEFAQPIHFCRKNMHKAYKVKMLGTFCIYPDRSQYIQFFPHDTAVGEEGEECFVYISQPDESDEFINFFMNKYKI